MNYDRIILELMDRVATLEDEVKALQKELVNKHEENISDNFCLSKTKETTSRDTTKFFLNGKKYGKNRLVLAIVQKYVQMHPDITAAQLMLIFDKSLQGSLGVVRTLEDVKTTCSDYQIRFFTSPDELITTKTDTCVVCTQWGVSNIGNILARAEQLGIEIQIIK